MKKLLFICNAGRNRSITAANIFKDKYLTRSAGVGEDAELDPSLLEWADVVYVMEDWQRTRISELFPKEYMKKKIISLDIPDVYSLMQPELVKLLKKSINRSFC